MIEGCSKLISLITNLPCKSEVRRRWHFMARTDRKGFFALSGWGILIPDTVKPDHGV